MVAVRKEVLNFCIKHVSLLESWIHYKQAKLDSSEILPPTQSFIFGQQLLVHVPTLKLFLILTNCPYRYECVVLFCICVSVVLLCFAIMAVNRW